MVRDEANEVRLRWFEREVGFRVSHDKRRMKFIRSLIMKIIMAQDKTRRGESCHCFNADQTKHRGYYPDNLPTWQARYIGRYICSERRASKHQIIKSSKTTQTRHLKRQDSKHKSHARIHKICIISLMCSDCDCDCPHARPSPRRYPGNHVVEHAYSSYPNLPSFVLTTALERPTLD